MHSRRHHNSIRDTLLTLTAILFFVIGPVLLAIWQIEQSRYHNSPILLVKTVQLRQGEYALKRLASTGFDLQAIRKDNAPVPEIYFASLPRELTRIKDAGIKKEIFFSSLLPPILKVNETILADRRKLKKLILKITLETKISETDYYWLAQKLQLYKVKVKNIQAFLDYTEQILNQLLNRMNMIPPELALAQAAQESGWGTSRFAQNGNALYGQWTWDDGCGMVPRQRDQGKTHRMKCFKSIIEAVDSYMLNLNTHRAYAALRQERSRFRDDQVMDVIPLAETLTNYSEEGADYVEKIKNIIRVNRLGDFKQARLQKR